MADKNKKPLTKMIAKKTVGIVDDEPDILELVTINLEKAGYSVKGFDNASEFLETLPDSSFDLLILDIMLPDYDGFELCKLIKGNPQYSDTPVIMLSAKSEEMEKVFGLEIGADDYVTKPFSPRELVARVKAVIRRDQKTSKADIIKVGDLLEIDNQKYEIKVAGVKIDLTSSEFKIIKLLSEKKGWVYDREQILNFLGGGERGVLDRTVDVHIKNLREKLGEAGQYVKNIRGVGYKLEA
ncbi:MAG: response regulator transcription factor [Candidatus Kapaibacteriales bacterium]